MTFLVVDRRFRGPAGSGNGGYTCGLVAQQVDGPTVEVTLRTPPPLDTPLRWDEGKLFDGDVLVAEARAAELDLDLPEPVAFAAARAAEAARPPDDDHPFPNCFVCGPARDDGLGLRPTPLGDGRVVATWVPDTVTPELVWASLDCPGAFAGDPEQARGLSVLGRLVAHVEALPAPGDELVVVAWPLPGGEGRRFLAGTALFDGDRPLAWAKATWFVVGDEMRDGPLASRK